MRCQRRHGPRGGPEAEKLKFVLKTMYVKASCIEGASSNNLPHTTAARIVNFICVVVVRACSRPPCGLPPARPSFLPGSAKLVSSQQLADLEWR